VCNGMTVDFLVSDNPAGEDQNVSFSSSVSGGSGPYSYQWYFNNDSVVDSTAADPTFNFSFPYNVYDATRLLVTDASGCKAGKSHTLVVDNGTEVFPLNGRLPKGWQTTVGADAGWRVGTSFVNEGVYSLTPRRISQGETASIEYTDVFQPGNITFWYRDNAGDKLRFYIDASEVMPNPNSSGAKSVPITAGTHTIRWEYARVSAQYFNGTLDRHWIDEVVLPVLYEDLNRNGVIDSVDLGIMMSAWGGNHDKADLNNDDVVNAIDLTRLAGSL